MAEDGLTGFGYDLAICQVIRDRCGPSRRLGFVSLVYKARHFPHRRLRIGKRARRESGSYGVEEIMARRDLFQTALTEVNISARVAPH